MIKFSVIVCAYNEEKYLEQCLESLYNQNYDKDNYEVIVIDNESKYILKKFALKYLPYDIVYRKKQMFTVPIGEWFKTKLKDYIIKMIDSDSLKNRGIFDTAFLNKILNEHIDGTKDYTRELRAIVNLELWFREFMDEGN
jgi:glycosyltransferase involved in cell wall biosynthesis